MKKASIILFACAVALSARAEEAAPQMSPEEQAMMAKMQERTTPNEKHKVLEALAGSWNYKGSFWMDPAQPPEVMTGVSDNKMIYGGRFLEQKISSTWQGQTFEGMSLTGYDLVRGEYISFWMDNMGTGIMDASGQYDAATKTLTTECTFSCPMTGEKDRWSRSETKFVDADNYVYTSYSRDQDGKEWKSMEIAYYRTP
jgi:hypothetical protein